MNRIIIRLNDIKCEQINFYLYNQNYVLEWIITNHDIDKKPVLPVAATIAYSFEIEFQHIKNNQMQTVCDDSPLMVFMISAILLSQQNTSKSMIYVLLAFS